MQPIIRTEIRRANSRDFNVVWTDVKECFTVQYQGIEKHSIIYRRLGDQTTINEKHFTVETDDVPSGIPEVLCGDCQGDTFKIRFGAYEVIAICAVCLKAAVIYDG